MKWYLNLNIDQKINLKQLCVIICGINFETLSLFNFSFKDKISLIYDKLKYEGFEIK